LKGVSVNDNPIEDDGMSLIVEHLHDATTLAAVLVYNCGMSANGNISYSVIYAYNKITYYGLNPPCTLEGIQQSLYPGKAILLAFLRPIKLD